MLEIVLYLIFIAFCILGIATDILSRKAHREYTKALKEQNDLLCELLLGNQELIEMENRLKMLREGG